jgi:lipopolysaccharide export LptBFGC system permease protein LptF
MRWPRTLSLYLAREIALFAGLSVIGVTCILLSQQLLERLDTLLIAGFTGADYLRVLLNVLSILGPHAIPISFAFGVTLTFGRLASNNEILAIRSLGIGLGSLLLPAAALGLVMALVTGWLIRDVEPNARVDLRQMLADVAFRGTIVQEGRFRGVGDRVIFVEERTGEGELKRIMIYDRTNPLREFVAFAESGELHYDETTRTLDLTLRSGQIQLDPEGIDESRVQTVHFNEFSYSVDADSLLDGRYALRNPDELAIAEIRDVIHRIDNGIPLEGVRKPRRDLYVLELQQRLAMPFAPLLFGLLAVPIGVASRRSAQTLGLIACTSVVFGYYALITFGQFLVFERWVAPELASWGPNFILVLAALVLIRRVSRSSGE